MNTNESVSKPQKYCLEIELEFIEDIDRDIQSSIIADTLHLDIDTIKNDLNKCKNGDKVVYGKYYRDIAESYRVSLMRHFVKEGIESWVRVCRYIENK